MYTPRSFQMEESAIPGFLTQNPFGQLLIARGGRKSAAGKTAAGLDRNTGSGFPENGIEIGLAPFILQQGSPSPAHLLGHIARASPLARSLTTGTEASVFFLGPHAYVSPNNYLATGLVPTWNYQAVLAEGTLSVIQDHDQLREILDRTTQLLEGDSIDAWRPDWSDPAMENLLSSIVGVDLEVRLWSGKEKLAQNRSDNDYNRLRQNFANSPDGQARSLAAAMPERIAPSQRGRPRGS